MTDQVEDPQLMIGSFIWDETHRNTGVVEEFKEGLVRYSVRTALGSARNKEYWTSEPCCYVLLESFPQTTRADRLLFDFFNGNLDRFKETDEQMRILWTDEDGMAYSVRLVLGD